MKKPLNLKVVDDVLRIEIGLDVLAHVAQWILDEEHFIASGGVEPKSPDRVVDNVGFAKALIRQLSKEGDRDGSTPLTRLIYDMTIQVFESGDESISCSDD